MWQVKILQGRRPRKEEGGSTASRRLAAHRHGLANCYGVRSIKVVPDVSRISMAAPFVLEFVGLGVAADLLPISMPSHLAGSSFLRFLLEWTVERLRISDRQMNPKGRAFTDL